ncbi:MAG TPA: MauE/DoxX family redox-associated membrane protein [Streptosporangiaceae bacterium]|nr:MauE/DoxX family redox-associated membrane protein [Streptosporangiaceae bacterium]
MLAQVAGNTIAIALGLVFLVAGCSKLRSSEDLEGAVVESGVHPRVACAIRILPVVEVLSGIGCLIPGSRVYAVIVSAGMLIIFVAWQAWVIIRGNRVQCHCFGRNDLDVGARTIVRTQILGMIALVSVALLSNDPIAACAVVGAAVLAVGVVAFSAFGVLARVKGSASLIGTQHGKLEIAQLSVRTAAAGSQTLLPEIISDHRNSMLVFLSPDCEPCQIIVKRDWGRWLSICGQKTELRAIFCLPSLVEAPRIPGTSLLMEAKFLGAVGIPGTPTGILVDSSCRRIGGLYVGRGAIEDGLTANHRAPIDDVPGQ